MQYLVWSATILCLAAPIYGAFDIAFDDDSDLTSFYSRPDIKSPILDVQAYNKEALVPGYFFVAPYAAINQHLHAPYYYQPCQTGPAIYDADGELVWSGACLGRNQNACDFRSTSINGSDYLSAIMHRYANDTTGHGMVLDNTFRSVARIEAPFLENGMNMHELLLLPSPQGASAIHLTAQSNLEDLRGIGTIGQERGWAIDTGFREVNIETGETIFDWWPRDHIPLTQSTVPIDDNAFKRPPSGWNWFHGNSVDKNANGDYLLNSRYTNAMYKVSGIDKSIIWQLGGANSSFVLDGFNFSRQHDARWISYNETTEVISFLDNAADSFVQTANISSALVVALDKNAEPPTARILSRIWRPDGQLSRLRGNYQTFSNSNNTFVGWSGEGYMTEHAEDGSLLLEARFRSTRFVTYRSYKYNFTGTPADESPALKPFVFGVSEATSTTVAYVSWNGATEVDTWNFYTNAIVPIFIGSRRKSGFETMFQTQGYYGAVFAVAVDKGGVAIGQSRAEVIARPVDWQVDPEVDQLTKNPPKSHIPVETRSRNKTVMEVSGSEACFINPQPLEDEIRNRCAVLTDIESLAGAAKDALIETKAEL